MPFAFLIVYSNHKNSSGSFLRLIPGRFRRIPHLDEACACRQQQIARSPSSSSSATVITTLSYSFQEPSDNRRSESFFICLRSAHRVSSDVSHCARVALSSEVVSNCPAKRETVASASSSSFLCFITQQPANHAIPLHRASKMSPSRIRHWMSSFNGKRDIARETKTALAWNSLKNDSLARGRFNVNYLLPSRRARVFVFRNDSARAFVNIKARNISECDFAKSFDRSCFEKSFRSIGLSVLKRFMFGLLYREQILLFKVICLKFI